MSSSAPAAGTPVLLFDDECGVCRFIAGRVRQAAGRPGAGSLTVRPIGEDPEALRSLNPGLDIWQAYATVHVIMPDGTMKLGGEAVAEVLRRLPATSWLAGVFSYDVAGFRPFQKILDLAYVTLADVRPLFGCASCGAPGGWVRPVAWLVKSGKAFFSGAPPVHAPHFSVRRGKLAVPPAQA